MEKNGRSTALNKTVVADIVLMVGLGLDIFGAVFLAKGFMAKRIKDIAEESGAYWNFNSYLRDSLARQQVEAWIGGVSLALGFLCQVIYYAIRPGSSDSWVVAIALILPLILWFIFIFVSARVSTWRIKSIDNAQLAEEIGHVEKNTPNQISNQLEKWAQRCGVPRQSGESDAAFLERIKVSLR